jgi:hypothetical protein
LLVSAFRNLGVHEMDDTDDRTETTSLNNPYQIRRHDQKLWEREVRKVQEQEKRLMVCPCVSCKGKKQRKPINVEQHLKRYGRDPEKCIVHDPNDLQIMNGQQIGWVRWMA